MATSCNINILPNNGSGLIIFQLLNLKRKKDQAQLLENFDSYSDRKDDLPPAYGHNGNTTIGDINVTVTQHKGTQISQKIL